MKERVHLAMPCPKCGSRMAVTDSRSTHHMNEPAVRRRRTCVACHHRLTTFEKIKNDLTETKVIEIMTKAKRARAALTELLDAYTQPNIVP